MTHYFDIFELDATRAELRRAGRILVLPPKTIEVLRYLVERSDRIVTRKELIELVATDRQRGCSILPFHIRKLREVLDTGASDGLLITVRGHGYRIGCPVSHAVDLDADGVDAAPPELRPPLDTTQRMPSMLRTLARMNGLLVLGLQLAEVLPVDVPIERKPVAGARRGKRGARGVRLDP